MDGKEEKNGEVTARNNVKTSAVGDIYDWIEVFAVSVAIVVLMLTFIMRIATVRGNSMIETLHNGDVLIISDILYTPTQGDIVVIQQNDSVFDEPIVKRIIAKGGQTIVFDFASWSVTVDGVKLNEEYVNRVAGAMDSDSLSGNTVVVPEGYMFVMGDNRNGSTDSRSTAVGFVRENEVIGKVIIRLFPLGQLGKVN